MNTLNLEDIFSNLNITVQAKPSRLDPLSDMQRNNMRLDYTARYGRTAVPFMDFSNGDRRWLDFLIEELAMIGDVYREDKIIMLGYSTAKRETGGKQTWQQYVDGLYADKVLPRKDYSEAQLKHLPTLINELRSGKRLAGCGTLEFYEMNTGKTF
ncbi:hypothetical protein M2267_001031 [Ensifer sp. KUDG1]|uniref:hypothetical protein n=1 Tax=Ensifer sp. KUDG1 TaxID=3373919 RepID=UPI003D21165A